MLGLGEKEHNRALSLQGTLFGSNRTGVGKQKPRVDSAEHVGSETRQGKEALLPSSLLRTAAPFQWSGKAGKEPQHELLRACLSTSQPQPKEELLWAIVYVLMHFLSFSPLLLF